MQLQDFWGIGPKTRDQLISTMGESAAIRAIQNADVAALVGAGLSPGRATAILRRATSDGDISILATRDTREVYSELVGMISEYALTPGTANRIRILTPFSTRNRIQERLEAVTAAMDTWSAFSETTQSEIVTAFETYASGESGDLAAVNLVLELQELDITDGIFDAIATLEADQLATAADALAAYEGDTLRDGTDPELDRYRHQLAAIERLEGNAFDVLEAIREEGIRNDDAFQSAVVQYLSRETDIEVDTIRRAAPDDAVDEADFVGTTLRNLSSDLTNEVEERESETLAELESTIENVRPVINEAVDSVDHLALHLSLARFALANDCSQPHFADGNHVLAAREARNLNLVQGEESVQPITYGLGTHAINGPPVGDRAAVLTGANSGGKTTLLETCCQIVILAHMGLPVPATEATVSLVDSIVFHRRHASFNAGVLESTLKSIVPPLASDGRTLMLVDEFEAITEPGSAADLLHGLVTLTVDRDALGVFVTHLADDLRPLPEVARIDGIFAEGLDDDLSLVVDYQPRFGELGRSTPEFILSRLIANARDRTERAGFDVLATALGAGDIQQTLTDSQWAE